MSKKTVISDFGDLKGRISFSDTDTILSDSNDNKAAEDGCLKVGQSVVLIDHDLRGRIIALGRTATIELEDGLVIKASYGEFAVTDQAELTDLRQAKVKPHRGTAGEPTNGRQSQQLSAFSGGSLSIDLHIEAIPGGRSIPKGQQLQFQLDTFRRVIRENLSHRGMKITFIHGIGDGILKAAIRKELDEVLALRCSYSVGDPAVTVVQIR